MVSDLEVLSGCYDEWMDQLGTSGDLSTRFRSVEVHGNKVIFNHKSGSQSAVISFATVPFGGSEVSR